MIGATRETENASIVKESRNIEFQCSSMQLKLAHGVKVINVAINVKSR